MAVAVSFQNRKQFLIRKMIVRKVRGRGLEAMIDWLENNGDRIDPKNHGTDTSDEPRETPGDRVAPWRRERHHGKRWMEGGPS